MASFEPQDFGLDEPPPRPTTPPVRRGFLIVLVVLSFMAILVYGIPYVAEQSGYAWEAGRSRAAMESLAKLDKAGIISRSSLLFREASKAVAPAVVHVQTRRVQRGGRAINPPPGAGRRFGRGFESLGLGSGVIIDKDNGYVVTNHHVVKDADEIVVRLSHGTDVPARVVGSDEKTDLAVLKIDAEVRVAAEWGDSDKLDIGDWVLAIGSPFAIDRTVTAGIVSATERNDLRINEYESFIQTDAAINPGNSGGPLIDLTGKVVGINAAIISETGGYAGIGLAIPASMARRVVEALIKQGKVVRGYLGVRIQPLNPALVREFHLPGPQGALVSEVISGSPAERAHLQMGDVIVKIGNHDVRDPAGLKNETASLPVGQKTTVSFYREGKLQTAEVTIAELAAGPAPGTLGFRVREVPGDPGAGGGEKLLIIDDVQPGSPADLAGLRPGMRVVGVGRRPVRSLAEYEAAAASINPVEGLPLRIALPDGQTAFVTVGGPGGR
jgi:serine protease Do